MTEIINNLLQYVELYGFILIIVFGMMHPFFGFPQHILALTVSIAVFGIVKGYLLLLLGNIIGIALLYVVVNQLKRIKKTPIKEDGLVSKIADWLRTEPMWKHIVVLGAPLIPSHPIKYTLPISGISFAKHMAIFTGAYLLLFLGNTFLYFGTLSFITDRIPVYVGVILITLFITFVYFGKYIFKKEQLQ